MKWASKRRGDVPKTEWHRWFAWYPVHVGANTKVWWEWVRRKGTYHMGPDADWSGWTWEYK